MTKEQALNTIKEKIEKYLSQDKERLSMWENVKRVKTKGGEDFKTFSKNIEGAIIEKSNYGPKHNEYITVKGWAGYSIFVEDTIRIYGFVDELPKDDERRERANDKSNIWRQTYDFNLDEVFKTIEERKELIETRIHSYEEQLKNVEKMVDKAFAIVDQIKGFLKEEPLRDEVHLNTLGYAIKNLITEKVDY